MVTGQCPDEEPSGRGVGAVMTDTALRLLSGREVGQVQPAEVHLVMTDRSLLGTSDQTRSVMEPARAPGTARSRHRWREPACAPRPRTPWWAALLLTPGTNRSAARHVKQKRPDRKPIRRHRMEPGRQPP